MRPISDESYQEQLDAKTEQLYQKHTELLKVKAILSSTETELRGADLLITKLKAQGATKDKLIKEFIDLGYVLDDDLIRRAKESQQ
jgi:hypothetical protein